MSTEVVVDASVWVSWLITEDTNHNASRHWMTQYLIAGGLLITPTFLLIEVAATISRRTGQTALVQQTINKLNAINAMRLVPMDFTLVQIGIVVATNTRLRAGDATYTAAAYQLGVPLLSWDKEQLQRASNIVKTYSPATYPF